MTKITVIQLTEAGPFATDAPDGTTAPLEITEGKPIMLAQQTITSENLYGVPRHRLVDHLRQLGLPAPLAFLWARIYWRLPVEKQEEFRDRLFSAFRPGVDLSEVWPQLAAWLLDDANDGVIRSAKTDATRNAIRHMSRLLRDGWTDENEYRKASAVLAARWAEESPWMVAQNWMVESGRAMALADRWTAEAGAETERWRLAASALARWSAELSAVSVLSMPEEARTNRYVKLSEKLLELLRAA